MVSDGNTIVLYHDTELLPWYTMVMVWKGNQWERRPEAVFFFNGCQWRRGFTTLNKQLFRGNSSSFIESTAYLLIYNMFYTKQYFWIELFFEFTMTKMLFYKSHCLFATGGIQLMALLIHSYGIRKRPIIVAQL